jgi:hypothetical protein
VGVEPGLVGGAEKVIKRVGQQAFASLARWVVGGFEWIVMD